MKYCKICYSRIELPDYVDWVVMQENYKYILGKYRWVPCDYCIDCINISKTLLWRLYLNTLLNTDCQNTLLELVNKPIPVYITDNLALDGKPIKGLFYHNQMYSTKLNTGLSDYQYYSLNKIIEKYKNKNNNKNNDEIQNLLSNLKI
jgi:hypothetical protein